MLYAVWYEYMTGGMHVAVGDSQSSVWVKSIISKNVTFLLWEK